MRYSNWRRRVWLPALAEAGLDDIEPLPEPHDLRRLNVTQLAASGVDLRTLMSRMGHKSAKLALEVYAKPDPWRIERRRTRLGRTFSLRCRTWSARRLPARRVAQENSIFEQVVYP